MSAQPPPTSERDALQLQSPTPKMELNILSPKKAKYASGKAVIVREYLEEVFVNEIQAGSIDFEVTVRHPGPFSSMRQHGYRHSLRADPANSQGGCQRSSTFQDSRSEIDPSMSFEPLPRRRTAMSLTCLDQAELL